MRSCMPCHACAARHIGRSLLCIASLLRAEPRTVTSVNSPGKALQVALQLDDGKPRYRVQRLGDTVIGTSRLGFQLRGGRLDRDLAVLAQAMRSVDETWEHPWDERRYVRNRYNALRVDLGERGGQRRRSPSCSGSTTTAWVFRYSFPHLTAPCRSGFSRDKRHRYPLSRPIASTALTEAFHALSPLACAIASTPHSRIPSPDCRTRN